MTEKADKQTAQTTNDQAPANTANATTGGASAAVVAKVEAMLKGSHAANPATIAKLIHENPAAKADIMLSVHKLKGNDYANWITDLAQRDDVIAENQTYNHDHKDDKNFKKRRVSPGYVSTTAEGTGVALNRIAAKGKLNLTKGQIWQLDQISSIETSGKAAAVDTTDDEVVSIGFDQLVLGSLSIQRLMEKVPAAFKKHGLELHPSAKYDFKDRPRQIVGAEHEELLRTHEWGDKFLAASGEDEVLGAMAEYAIQKDQAKTIDLEKKDGATNSFWDDDTARAWITEVYNSRPSFTEPTIKAAIAAGADSAKTREAFLDILSKAVISVSARLEPLNALRLEKEAYTKAHGKKSSMPQADATAWLTKNTAHYTKVGTDKGTHIVTKISRDPNAGPADGGDKHAKKKPAPAPTGGGGDHHVAEHHDTPAVAPKKVEPPPEPTATVGGGEHDHVAPKEHHDAPAPIVAHHDDAKKAPLTAPPAPTMRVTASALHMRSAPDKDHESNIIATLHHHEVVEATGTSGAWIQAKHGGHEGFVFGEFVEPVTASSAAPAHHETAAAPHAAAPHAAAHAAAPHAPAPTPAPPEHHETPKAAPAPVALAPEPKKPEHHDTAPAAPAQAKPPVKADTPATTPVQEPVAKQDTTHKPASPTNPNNHADTTKDVFSAVYQAGADKHTQYTQVYVSPGGLTTNTPNVFLFFHGHVAQYNIDPNQKEKSVDYHNKDGSLNHSAKTLISGKDAAEEAMAHARGTDTICILPQGVVGANGGGTHEGGYMEAINAGLPSFMKSVMGQLAHDIKVPDPTKPLTPGHLSIAGHSAGGYEGISSALNHAKDKDGDLYDVISDVTLMDSGYGEPAHFKQTLDWMLQGKPGKNVRIVAQNNQLVDANQGYKKYFDRGPLRAVAEKHGYKFEDLAWNDKPTKETRVMQHSRITKDGAPHAEVLVMKYYDETGMTHHNLRDHVMDDAVLSVGEGQRSNGKTFGNEEFGRHDKGGAVHDENDASTLAGQGQTQAPAPAKPKAEAHATVAPTPTPDDKATAISKPKHEDAPKKPVDTAHVDPAKQHHDAPKKPAATAGGDIKASHDHKAGHYDHDHGLDSFGNQTESTRESQHSSGDAGHVFKNSFTTVTSGTTLYSGPDSMKKFSKEDLPMGTRLHVVNVSMHRAQIVTSTITADQNVWINFTNLGGKPEANAVIPLGNELSDPKDKERANAIRAGLPSTIKPGESKFHWQFGSKFKPSFAGTAMDSGLMAKVNALMNWAIANDMVTDNIVIGEGMRDPTDAHYMSTRFYISQQKMDPKFFDKEALKDSKKMPGGKDQDGHVWYQPGWTDEQIIENASKQYSKSSTRAVAAEGYNFGNDKRLPMKVEAPGQGVSAHCSGHAVDVTIPWRDAKHPDRTDEWGWEEIYHQFGLTRPLHKDRGGAKGFQESWHVEETGKNLNLEYDHEESPK